MRILFTADLHLNMPRLNVRTQKTLLEDFTDHVRRENPDAVIIAGDLGVPASADAHVRFLREAVGDRPLAVCLGNHDFWLASNHHSFPTLDSVIDSFWEKPTRDFDVILLDRENADLGGVKVVGGYGHFDLGLAVPDLAVNGVLVTEKMYRFGGMNKVMWNDLRFIPHCTDNIAKEAQLQAAGLAQRLDSAISSGSQVLIATHTCPWRELIGHPIGRGELDILHAYSGNSLVGAEMATRAAAIKLCVCGHTHYPVRERKVNDITSLNIGTDLRVFRGVIYDTQRERIRWIGRRFR